MAHDIPAVAAGGRAPDKGLRMNLAYLIISKKNARFAQSRGVGKWKVRRNGVTWLGVRVGNERGRIYVENATDCQPFRGRPGSVGWYAQALEGEAEVVVRFVSEGKTVSKRRLMVTKNSFEPIVLPWPVEPFTSPLDLEISCSGPLPVFIASHFELDRNLLFSRCKGKGVELGPGPNPHIRPGPETEVFYVEQKSPDEWVRLYGDHYKYDFDPSLAPFYVIGEAHRIAVQAESLDFIYSSHVFEHLVNPLGHLEIWSGLLRKGGEVLMVIPDYIGSKDYLADATTLQEVLSEYHQGSFDPSFDHYRRYGHARGTPQKAQSLFDKKSSIHMHYYSNDNMRDLLQMAVDKELFEKYTIIHSQNAKDFHVILVR
jgi:predicted SAM-dependent methyltransferase